MKGERNSISKSRGGERGTREEQAASSLPCAGFSCPLAPSGAAATGAAAGCHPGGLNASTGEGQEHQGGLGLSDG